MREKLDNFWYHNKWKVIIITFIVIVAAVCIPQLFARKTYNIMVMYAGPKAISTVEYDAIISDITKAALAAGITSPSLNFSRITYIPEELAKKYEEEGIFYNGAMNYEAFQAFQNSLIVGDYIILLLDKSLYGYVSAPDILSPLSELSSAMPESANDEYSVYISAIKDEYSSAFSVFPQDTLICLRKYSYIQSLMPGSAKRERTYNNQKSLFYELLFNYN